MPEIRVEHFSYAYPGAEQAVLRNINLSIPRGEFVLVAGPSGCGKSTLAMALAGLIPVRIPGSIRGQVIFGDKVLGKMEIHETSQHIGMVFQNPDNQLIHLDVEAEVAFGPENLGLPRDEISRRVREAIAFTQMEHHTSSSIHALSGGQKQRIAISAALAMQPDVLVLDEPTSDLDPAGTQEVLQVLHKLNRERQMTIVLIEHKIDEVIPWVNRVLLMDQGQILLDGPPQTVFKDECLWDDLGVSVPEMARLSHRMPEIFGGRTALCVEEAFGALRKTQVHEKIRRRSGISLPVKQDSHPDRNGTALLEWRNIGLSFGERQVLKDANLTLCAGEWVALAGPNGSGKTSLAALAMGFQAPTSGTIHYQSGPVRMGNISKQAAQIGYLFQAADHMLFASSVRDEIRFGKKHKKSKDNLLQRMKIEEIAQIIDLKDQLDKNPFHLSHGQRKRLAIGALLAANPKMMILDEPTTGQDEGHAGHFLQFLQKLRDQLQMTYLMITHDMRAAARYADRLVVLNKGRVVLNGPPAQVFAHADKLAEANIVPPPIAKLHVMLAEEPMNSAALDLHQFLSYVKPEGVLI